MTKDRLATHEELGVEMRLSSLERIYIRYRRIHTTLMLMIFVAIVVNFSMAVALKSEMSELKKEVFELKEAVWDLKKAVSELKKSVSALMDIFTKFDGYVSSIETYLRLNGTASPSLSNNSSLSPEES